ncbi:MAG: CBS domain-containing protein [Endomicrobiales bacterium]|nr:CBS domain-containing protein [Endomicrobiales bacterium]
MLIKDIMLKNVLSVERSTTLSRLLKSYEKFHGLPLVPVVDENKHLVGQVSIQDILSVFTPHGRDLQRILDSLPFVEREKEDIFSSDIPSEMGFLIVVDDFMDRKVISLSEDLPIEEAYQTFGKYSVDEALVVNKENQLVGIIGKFDIILAVFRQKGII